MKKLFLGVLLAGSPWLLPGIETVTYRSSSGVPLHSSDTLRKLERFLKELFPKTLYPKNALIIDITGPGIPPPPAPGVRLELKSTGLDSFSLETLSAAGGAILHAYGKAAPGFRLPLFLCAAFRHRERSSKKEARFLGNNRQLRSVEVFMHQEGKLPLKEVLALQDPDSDPVLAAWYDDHARLLFEMLRRKGFKGSARELLPAAERLLKSDTLSEDTALHFWNSFKILPPHLVRKELDKIGQVRLPRLDHNGEPNGLFEDVPAAQMPLTLRQHPLRRELFYEYAAKVLDVSARSPRFMRGALRELHDSANSLGKVSAPDREERFVRALAGIEETFRISRSRAQALDEAALKMENPVLLLQNSLLENSRPGRIAAPEAERFLQRWNEYYNSN